MDIPNPMEGQPPVSMPILTGRQQQEMALAEQQKKMRDALGLLSEQEKSKAQFREQPETPETIFAKAKARAAGERAGAPPIPKETSGSMTGEGGQPLLASEIVNISDIDSSLKEAENLKQKVTSIKGGTGILAGIQAELPNPIVGALSQAGFKGAAEAKTRLGTIKLVKQIIGKGLEGGVLRKEDEYKYEQILPTMSDPPDVAAAKLEGLVGTLQRKRETALESYASAGRDVSKFQKPAAAPTSGTGSKYKIVEVR